MVSIVRRARAGLNAASDSWIGRAQPAMSSKTGASQRSFGPR
jgi:hypothetical protein